MDGKLNKDSKIELHSGNKMPVLGLGTWQLTDNTAKAVTTALEIGYRLIDTSSDYGSQPGIGAGIKESQIPRSEIFLTTKVEETDDAYTRTVSNLEELELEYIDLCLIHRPPQSGVGEDLWEGLRMAKKDGLTRDIGVSNYSIDQIKKLIEVSRTVPAVNQIEWSPFGYSEDMLEYCRNNKIIIQAYSPITRKEKLEDPVLEQIAENYRKTPAQILLRWNLQIGSVPLPKANQKKHLDENIDIFDFELSEDDMEKLSSLNEKYSSLGLLPYT